MCGPYDFVEDRTHNGHKFRMLGDRLQHEATALEPGLPSASTCRCAGAGYATPTRSADHLNRRQQGNHALDLNQTT